MHAENAPKFGKLRKMCNIEHLMYFGILAASQDVVIDFCYDFVFAFWKCRDSAARWNVQTPDPSKELAPYTAGRLREVTARVEGFGCRATESFESLNNWNSVKIPSEFRKIHQKFSEKFWNLRNYRHFLKYSATFREIFVRIGAKFDEKCWKLAILQIFQQ